MKFILDLFEELEEAFQFMPPSKYKIFLLGSLMASLDCLMSVILISFVFILEYLFGDIGSKIAYGSIDILAIMCFILLIRRCKSIRCIIRKIHAFLFNLDLVDFLAMLLVAEIIQIIIENW